MSWMSCVWLPGCYSHHGLLVSLLNGVAGDLAVPVVLGRLPLQRHVESPNVDDLQHLRGPREIYDADGEQDQRTCGTASDLQTASPTYNLHGHARRVFHVLDLHLEVILPRVLFLRLADEEDGVPLTVPDTGECGAEGLPVFTPCDLWPGLSLNTKQVRRSRVT